MVNPDSEPQSQGQEHEAVINPIEEQWQVNKKEFAKPFKKNVHVEMGDDQLLANITAIVEAEPKNRIGLPEGFSVGLETRGVALAGPDEILCNPDKTEFTIGDKKVKLGEIVPEGVDVYIGGGPKRSNVYERD